MHSHLRTSTVVAGAAAVAIGALGAGSALGTSARGTAPRGAISAGRGVPVPTLPRAHDFVPRVSNPYLPLRPGTRWVYVGHGAEKGERNIVTVLHRTRVIEGIASTVVHDVVREGGELVEDTYDWYAQDRLGNVWYLGERTKELENGHVVSREGSWEAGVGDAQAGIAMPAGAEGHHRYRQEFDLGNAEDEGEVVLQGGQVRVPFGHVDRVRVTEDTTALEPAVAELKFYARGIGPVMEVGVSPGFSRSVLVSVVHH
jgi:hypothetical protein